MISAIIFDCDGVLVDSEVLALEVELEALAAAGLHYERAEFRDRFMGMSDAAFHAALDADAVARLGRAVMGDVREPMRRRYRESFAARLAEVPGALACVAGVSHRKAVASSSTEEGLNAKLRKAGLWEYFAPHIYSADHVARAKPAPDLFLHAADALQISPDRCLVIEDSINGVTAAGAAGMQVWGFLGGGHMDESCAQRLIAAGAGRVVHDWPEAARLFREL